MNPTVKAKFQNYMPLRVYKYLTQSTFFLRPFKAKALVHRQAASQVGVLVNADSFARCLAHASV